MNRNISIVSIGLLLLVPTLIFTSFPIDRGTFMTSLLGRVQLLRNHLQVPSSILRVFGANMSVSRARLRLNFLHRSDDPIIDWKQDHRLGFAWRQVGRVQEAAIAVQELDFENPWCRVSSREGSVSSLRVVCVSMGYVEKFIAFRGKKKIQTWY